MHLVLSLYFYWSALLAFVYIYFYFKLKKSLKNFKPVPLDPSIFVEFLKLYLVTQSLSGVAGIGLRI